MIRDFIKPYIQELVPYSTARDEFTGDARVFLDANENPFPSAVHRYPDPHQKELKELVANLKGTASDGIFLGNGSDEAIDLLVRVVSCGEPGITITPPTYGMYKVAALNNGVGLVEAPLTRDFALDYGAIRQASQSGSRLLFICSPNNPTGTVYSLDQIREALDLFNGIVVVDEAYIDFAEAPSAATLRSEYDRLVVLQTFSKAWGMAGLRLGITFAARPVIDAMNKLKLPYNISELNQRYALDRLREPEVMREEVRTIISERERMSSVLSTLLSVERVFPSAANFLLVRVGDAERAFRYLQEKGIIVRDRSRELHCEGCLRITIGTPAENDAVVAALREVA